MSEMAGNHDAMEDLVAAFTLGACEPDEVDEVRAHIQGCASCRELADRLARVAGALPMAVDEVRPPDRLRQRILEAAAGSARSEIAGPPTRSRIIRLPRPPRALSGWGSRWPTAAVAVLALAVVGLGAWDVGLTQQLGQGQAGHYQLQGTGSLSGSRANVITLRRDGVAVVDFTNMPDLDSGLVYEVWLMDPNGKATPAGVFRPEPDGSKTFLITHDLHGYNRLAVTTERGPDGVGQPTQNPRLVGQIV